MTKQKALFWEKENNAVRCELCPHHCLIREGQAGLCRVRVNIDGELFSTVYGIPSALQIDPIEKKPLYHFLPGTRTFSIGTQGCNLFCKFCQNWHLSAETGHHTTRFEPEDIVNKARESACRSIAFTYNEPLVFSEYALDIQKHAEKAGIPCVFITNGYASETARKEVLSRMQAVNIDLKAFTDEVYKTYTGGSLQPVLDTIDYCANRGIHTEITTLIIPGVNDSEATIEKECEWIIQHCGKDVPLHISAFHPDYKMKDHPMTSRETLRRTKATAEKCGLRYVYVGNYPGFDNNTYCSRCGEKIIDRNTYPFRINKDHKHKIPVIWSLS